VRASYFGQAIAGTSDPLVPAPIEGDVVQLRNVTRNRVQKREIEVRASS
jgi:hypothetical protein